MIKKVAAYIEKWQMLDKNDNVVVGVSGGADSVCLLFVLLSLREKYNLGIHVVHVNHGLRELAADKDAKYVEELCKKYRLPFHYYQENVESLAKKWKQSLEEAGREVRRKAFFEVREKYACNKIALAHHKNDSAETMLLNLARGTGLLGLGGIRPVNGSYIRPLLCMTRQEIEDYLAGEGICYCTDLTNLDDDYARNRIRNHVLQYMTEEINANTVQHMADTMEYLQGVQEYLWREAMGYKDIYVSETDGQVDIRAELFQAMPKVLMPILLKQLLVDMAGRAKDIESTHIQMVLKLASRQVGRQVDLPYDMVARRTYEGIRLQKRRKKSESEEPIFLQPNADWQEVRRNMYRIRFRVVKKADWQEKRLENSSTKAFDYDIINSMLCVRKREQGDFITLTQTGGRQKLKAFYINEKVDRELRDEILLLADGSHILWIVGYRTNPAYAVSENTTHILEIQIEKGEEPWQRQ